METILKDTLYNKKWFTNQLLCNSVEYLIEGVFKALPSLLGDKAFVRCARVNKITVK